MLEVVVFRVGAHPLPRPAVGVIDVQHRVVLSMEEVLLLIGKGCFFSNGGGRFLGGGCECRSLFGVFPKILVDHPLNVSELCLAQVGQLSNLTCWVCQI